MSGKNPAPPEGVEPPAVDPAMDDILASIRKILKDDDSPAGLVSQALADGNSTLVGPNASGPSSAAALAASALAFGGAPSEPAPPPPAKKPAKADASASPASTSPAGKPDGSKLASAASKQETMVSASNTPAAPATGPGAVMNASAAAATAASVGELIRAVAADRHVGVSRAGTTLEDIVREEMRPMIKDWLDRHLPGMVERLVRAEIERVVSRAMA